MNGLVSILITTGAAPMSVGLGGVTCRRWTKNHVATAAKAASPTTPPTTPPVITAELLDFGALENGFEDVEELGDGVKEAVGLVEVETL